MITNVKTYDSDPVSDDLTMAIRQICRPYDAMMLEQGHVRIVTQRIGAITFVLEPAPTADNERPLKYYMSGTDVQNIAHKLAVAIGFINEAVLEIHPNCLIVYRETDDTGHLLPGDHGTGHQVMEAISDFLARQRGDET
jgi:hypothetical protein